MTDGFPKGKLPQNVNIIKHRGDPNKARLKSGHTIEKTEFVVVKDEKEVWHTFMCMDYHGEHFVYLDPVNRPGGWFAWCTCGSPAVIISPSTARTLGVTKQIYRILACYHHTNTSLAYGLLKGGHATKWVNKKDFGR